MKLILLFCRQVIVAILIAITVYPIQVYAQPFFSDVSDDHMYSEAINSIYEKGIVQGYNDNTFRPNVTINRAEFLKIVMEGAGYQTGGANCYIDVQTDWFAKYVCKATELALVSGYPDKHFRPGQDINFAEASKIVANAFSLNVINNITEAWYTPFVTALEDANAVPPSVTTVDQKVTRGEMSEIIWRLTKDNNTGVASVLKNEWEGVDCYVFGESKRLSYEDSSGLTQLVDLLYLQEQRRLNEEFSLPEAFSYPSWKRKTEDDISELKQEVNRLVNQEIQRCIYLQAQ